MTRYEYTQLTVILLQLLLVVGGWVAFVLSFVRDDESWGWLWAAAALFLLSLVVSGLRRWLSSDGWGRGS